MPRVDELVDAIGQQKGKYFSTLDMMKGYHQVKWKSNQNIYLSFRTFPISPYALWLNEHSGNFPKAYGQDIARSGVGLSFVNLDDILIVSATFEDHLKEVGRVLDRPSEAGLHLKPSKCSFAQKEVEYLGFTISADSVRPNSAKIKAITEFPRPTDSTSVERFL